MCSDGNGNGPLPLWKQSEAYKKTLEYQVTELGKSVAELGRISMALLRLPQFVAWLSSKLRRK